MGEVQMATVSELNAYLKKVFDSQTVLNNIWIKGEISNFKHHYSGHMYITLKDEGGVLKAVMFKGNTYGLTFEPKDGMKVMARGRISVYEPSGAYQLYIEEMREDGVGDLYAAFEKLKKKLEAEGLFAPEHKKELPFAPSKIGVCTATTGAAVRDIINVITRRFPLSEIIIYPTTVQGDGAAESIVSGIELFNREKLADVLIIGRGGGSIEDLWAFNEEKVARAIFNSDIPIISAVGHETDFTIADFVSDLRAPTPSAAAELCVPSAMEIYSSLNSNKNKLIKYIEALIELKKLSVQKCKLKNPQEILWENSLKLDNLRFSLKKSIDLKIAESKKGFSELIGSLRALSPLAVLERGYSVAMLEDGRVISSVDDVNIGDEFSLTVADGKIKCSALEIRK